jgi:hypothetical protein
VPPFFYWANNREFLLAKPFSDGDDGDERDEILKPETFFCFKTKKSAAFFCRYPLHPLHPLNPC